MLQVRTLRVVKQKTTKKLKRQTKRSVPRVQTGVRRSLFPNGNPRRLQIQTYAESAKIQTDADSDRFRQVQSTESNKYRDEREQNMQTSADSDSRQTTDRTPDSDRQ
ncbi:hypothetical protein Tco_0956834 [Tanacetum coccineum]